MFVTPPRERAWVSWLAVALWCLSIFAAIPFARSIRNIVSDFGGREIFAHLTILAVIVAATGALTLVSRLSHKSISQVIWLLGTAAIFIGYTIQLRDAPEEAFHFVQYGVLGLLSYRALSHRLRDVGIYFVGAMIGAIIGIVDEAIQWLTPDRYWGLHDIWIDFLGGSLVLLGIAKGIRPTLIDRPLQPETIRWLCRVGAILLVTVTATVLNTPERINWYTSLWSRLEFLRANESVMFEYGYLYNDPETGPFRSRFTEEELRSEDRGRGQEAAQILDRFQDESLYRQFLETYTPVTDPFVHEARVHLFRRDRNLQYAQLEDLTELERQVFLTVAYREDRIMEKYFRNSYLNSSYVLSRETRSLLRENLVSEDLLPRSEVESGVSKHLVTSITEQEVLILVAVLALAFVVIDRRWGS